MPSLPRFPFPAGRTWAAATGWICLHLGCPAPAAFYVICRFHLLGGPGRSWLWFPAVSSPVQAYFTLCIRDLDHLRRKFRLSYRCCVAIRLPPCALFRLEPRLRRSRCGPQGTSFAPERDRTARAAPNSPRWATMLTQPPDRHVVASWGHSTRCRTEGGSRHRPSTAWHRPR